MASTLQTGTICQWSQDSLCYK